MIQNKVFYSPKKNFSFQRIFVFYCIASFFFLPLSIEKTFAQNQMDFISKNEHVNFLEPILGEKNASLSIVYFFDYNCHFCKEGFKEINLFLSENKNVRFVLKDFPLLGKESKKVHSISLAILQINPKQYKIFHNLLINSTSFINEKEALRLAESIGISKETIYTSIQKNQILEKIEDNMTLGETLGVRGTPAYLIHNNLVLGVLDKHQMEKKILLNNKN